MKKYIKGLLALAVTLCCVLTLSACGQSSDDSSWSDIKDNGELVIGLDDTFAPMGFRDDDGNLVGFDIDMAKAVCKELGIKATFKPIDWDSKELELKSKDIDCIWNGLSATEERQKSMSLSKKYLNNKIIIMTTDKNLKVGSSTDLEDLKIGTQKDSSALEMIQKDKNYDNFKDNVTEYDTYDEAILDMKAGRVDCIAIDEVLGNYKNTKMDENLYTCDYDFGNDYYAIGFRKSDKELTNKVNDALQTLIDNGTAAKISKKWFGKDIVILEDY
ncbi:MAG: amino acid ABC transporter substrate-binding protein [Anaerovoracaceae bacterium]|jgi:polar amino acid transport system substrate-binding protein